MEIEVKALRFQQETLTLRPEQLPWHKFENECKWNFIQSKYYQCNGDLQKDLRTYATLTQTKHTTNIQAMLRKQMHRPDD